MSARLVMPRRRFAAAARCHRVWEVEAARDRLLHGSALAAHQAHVAGCRECAREQAALEQLAREVRAAAPAADEMSLRRLRQATLERAFELSRTSLRASSRLRLAWAGAATALALSALSALYFVQHERAAETPPSITVTAGNAGGSWTRHSASGVEHVELGDGAFSLVVRRRPHDPRVIVRVPEGEIEDFGTSFDVRVQAGRTVRIAVREGSVMFRRRGAAPLRLSAGMVWSANERAPETAEAARAPATPTLPEAIAPPAPPRAPRAVRGAAKPAKREAAAARAEPAVSTSAEDVAYLHVLALLREGRGEDARLAAALYAQRFPNGFRRVEMERLALSAP